jgi:tRNA G46 methylase TrmB
MEDCNKSNDNDNNNVIDNNIKRIGIRLAPYNPSGMEVVDIAIKLLDIQDNDIFYDLGCGDGRLLITSCQLNKLIKCVGIEYDIDIYNKAIELVNRYELAEQITILHDNVLNVNFDNATKLFIYLVPDGIKQLKDKLVDALERDVIIVTYVFSIPDIQPSQVMVYKSSTKIYLYKK